MTFTSFKLFLLSTLVLGGFFFGSSESFGQSVGDQEDFFIDSSYDYRSRTELTATLRHVSTDAFFYIDDELWKDLSFAERGALHSEVIALGNEFTDTIYPTLRNTFGSESRPGIDGQGRVFVLLHQMREDAGGYFNSGDGYSTLQSPRSNEKELVYLNAVHAHDGLLRAFLAHEFVHLITFNQKDKTRQAREEVWLNELRAEYAPTLLGYDDIYEGSNLERRVRAFLRSPTTSLTEWQNNSADYATANLFAQYLVDHYGVRILKDSLQSSLTGIASLEHAFSTQGTNKDFSDLFTEWTLALLFNDCSLGDRYCYLNEHLDNLKIAPQSNFLPSGASANLAVTHATKNWAGNWQRIVGGRGTLRLEFDSHGRAFYLPYVTEDINGEFHIGSVDFNQEGKGVIEVPGFSTQVQSLTIIPVLQEKRSGFNGFEQSSTFSFSVFTRTDQSQAEQELREQLLAQIAQLQEELARLQGQLSTGQSISCGAISQNLSQGARGDQVKCLQEFLRDQGPSVYPEGLVTGYFGPLTHRAVVAFQELHALDILSPLGLTSGTGFVGQATRGKINELLR